MNEYNNCSWNIKKVVCYQQLIIVQFIKTTGKLNAHFAKRLVDSVDRINERLTVRLGMCLAVWSSCRPVVSFTEPITLFDEALLCIELPQSFLYCLQYNVCYWYNPYRFVLYFVWDMHAWRSSHVARRPEGKYRVREICQVLRQMETSADKYKYLI